MLKQERQDRQHPTFHVFKNLLTGLKLEGIPKSIFIPSFFSDCLQHMGVKEMFFN